jgi:anti-sigma factor RsiW
MVEDAAYRFDVTCRELVELVTDYLSDGLDVATSAAVDAHLRECPECRDYLWQMRATIAATGRLRRESVDDRTMTFLVSAFREFLGP